MSSAGAFDVLSGRRPTPVCERVPVLLNIRLSDRYRLLRFRSDPIAARSMAGQFVMVAPVARSTPVLPRPMAIYVRDADAGTVDIVYGVVGDGTRALAVLAAGEDLLVTGPLGRGFVIRDGVERILLVGRGVGICAMTTVAQDLAAAPVSMTAVLSGRYRESVLGQHVLRDCGADVVAVTDAAGSSAVAAVRERLRRELDDDPPQQILTSGSERLTRLVAELGARWNAEVQVSVEAHMACGLGYCHGCAAGEGDGTSEAPLVCRDGPVFGLRS